MKNDKCTKCINTICICRTCRGDIKNPICNRDCVPDCGFDETDYTCIARKTKENPKSKLDNAIPDGDLYDYFK